MGKSSEKRIYKDGELIKHPFNWMPKVEIKEFGPCKYPAKADDLAIGYDLYIPRNIVIPAHSRIVVPLNIGLNLPYNVEGKIEPRSGFSAKGMEGVGRKVVWERKFFGLIPCPKIVYGQQRFNADVLNGKIDPGYHDNIGVIIKNDDVEFVLQAGTRVAQMTFYRVLKVKSFVKVDELSGVDRGGGFGHSGTT